MPSSHVRRHGPAVFLSPPQHDLAWSLNDRGKSSYQNRPNGSGEPSPGLRPEADALGRKHNKPKRPVGPRELCSPSSVLSSLVPHHSRNDG